MSSLWTVSLNLHLDELRRDLLAARKRWPIIAERTRLNIRTVRSIAHNTAGYRNPCLSTLTSIADALAKLEQTPQHTNLR